MSSERSCVLEWGGKTGAHLTATGQLVGAVMFGGSAEGKARGQIMKEARSEARRGYGNAQTF